MTVFIWVAGIILTALAVGSAFLKKEERIKRSELSENTDDFS